MFSFFTRGWKRQIAEFKFDDGRADKFKIDGDDAVELKRARKGAKKRRQGRSACGRLLQKPSRLRRM
jgi:hypothetical protein